MNLVTLQKKQFLHDTNFHQDIVALSTQDRTKHLVLHFTKYMGNLISKNNHASDSIYADILICCMSLANILKFRINYNKSKNEYLKDNFPIEYSLSVSRMAKACEALDHMESFPSHQVLTEETQKIFNLITDFMLTNKIDIHKTIETRWKKIEENDITH